MKSWSLVGLASAVVGCGDVQNFSGDVPPLATLHVEVTGDLEAVRPPGQTAPPDLHVALVWGQQWLTEPLCILPAESAAAAAVIAAGCRDPFGFVPAQVDRSVPVTVGTPAELELATLPDASLLVGDLTARIGYGSLVVYDDRNGDGSLTLARANRQGHPDMGPDDGAEDQPTTQIDTVYGASFVTMTAPDVRLAYREGAFVPYAFYPRAGCGDPPPAFSVDAAGGFTAAAAVSATLAGMLPPEDPATCAQSTTETVIQIPIAPPADVAELACTERNADSTVRYREPDVDVPDFTGRTTACVHVPTFGAPTDVIELIVTGVLDGATPDACKGITHYILKGCREGPDCGTPDWDHSTAPPAWWPC